MRTCNSRWLLTVCFIVSVITCRAAASPGVVVESVTRSSEALASGMRVGDVLRSWSRGDKNGAIESPFDLMVLEIQEAPLGAVTIEGLRGTERHTWRLGPETWDVRTRPNFPPHALKLLINSREFLRDGKIPQAESNWLSIGSLSNSSWLYSWCTWDAAEFLARRKKWRAANAFYREAVIRAGSSPLVKSLLLREWALTFRESGGWAQVEEHLRESVREAQKIGDGTLLVATILTDSGVVSNWRRDLPAANQLFSRALAIQQRTAPASLVTARSFVNLASVALSTGDEKQAQGYLDNAKFLLGNFPPGPDTAQLDGYLGSIAARRGDIAAAEELFNRAQHILEPRWDETTVFARVLFAQSYVPAMQGDLVAAEPLLRRAAAIYEATPSDPSLGIYIANEMGTIANTRGDLDTAIAYTQKAERILEEISPLSVERGGCLMNLGLYALERDDLVGAEKQWRKAVGVIEKVVPNTLEHAQMLEFMANLELRRGKVESARTYATSAHEMLSRIGNQSSVMVETLQTLAELSVQGQALQQAEDYYNAATRMAERIYPGSQTYAELLAEMADLLSKEGEYTAALDHYQLAVDALEGQMARLGGSDTERIGFRKQHEVIYKRYIDLLAREGKPEQAFIIAERSRARTLFELLSEGKVHIRQHVDASLLEKEESLTQQFAALNDHRLRLMAAPNTEEQVKTLSAKSESVLKQFSNLESAIRESSPEYAALTQPPTITIRDVQQQLLDRDTILIEYSLGDVHSYLWLITSDSVSMHELPGRSQIERLALRVYGSMSQPLADNQKVLDSIALSTFILGPVANQLENKRLLVVADGALNYIPFAALPIPGEKPRRVLVTEHEVINLPSASVLMSLRRAHMEMHEPQRSVAVLADPVFSAEDPRLMHSKDSKKHGIERNPTNEDDVQRSIELTRSRWVRDLSSHGGNTLQFPRLTYSRREADAIVSTVPAGQSLEILDFSASRLEMLNPQLAEYKILHVATHGVFDPQHPEFSGLLFSLFDKHGNPQIGLLSLQDIYNLNLPIEMVVLSACKTALGKDITGEGIVGLTRGFMYAGASRVVASLWNVNDVATAQFMADFYRAMERNHLRPAAALRSAQLQMKRQKRWSSPYYWAAFQLQGDWN